MAASVLYLSVLIQNIEYYVLEPRIEFRKHVSCSFHYAPNITCGLCTICAVELIIYYTNIDICFNCLVFNGRFYILPTKTLGRVHIALCPPTMWTVVGFYHYLDCNACSQWLKREVRKD